VESIISSSPIFKDGPEQGKTERMILPSQVNKENLNADQDQAEKKLEMLNRKGERRG